jgi:hypothetical protein
MNVRDWLCANKLSLNIEKSNYVLFHPPQRKITFNFILTINQKYLRHEDCIKYLGIYIDATLSWKPQVTNISAKIKRSINWYVIQNMLLCKFTNTRQFILLFNLSVLNIRNTRLG